MPTNEILINLDLADAIALIERQQQQIANLNTEVEVRRKVMADIVKLLGYGFNGLSHDEIVFKIHDLITQLAKAKKEIERLQEKIPKGYGF
jgi:hypothetical protein